MHPGMSSCVLGTAVSECEQGPTCLGYCTICMHSHKGTTGPPLTILTLDGFAPHSVQRPGATGNAGQRMEICKYG